MEDMENLMQEFIEKQEAFHLLQMQFKTGEKLHSDTKKEITKYNTEIRTVKNKLNDSKQFEFHENKCQDVLKNISDFSANIAMAQIFMKSEKTIFTVCLQRNNEKTSSVVPPVHKPEELSKEIEMLKNEVASLEKQIADLK